MIRLITTAFCLILSLVLLSFALNGPCDSPVVGDHSGAPGETDCSGCHGDPLNPDIPNFKFEFGNNDSTYIPGTTYIISVSMVRPGHDKFGFVSSALDTLDKSKGIYSLINTITTRKYTLVGRNYISHTPCGADSPDSIKWTYNWTAPATDKGKITMYLAMLVANHDHAITGDTSYTKTLTINPEMSSATKELKSPFKAHIYPTVFNDHINIDFNNKYDARTKIIQLIDTNGKIIDTKKTEESFLVHHFKYSLSRGMYYLNINYGNSIETIKLIKK